VYSIGRPISLPDDPLFFQFTGSYDGKGFEIAGLFVRESTSVVGNQLSSFGLFGYTGSGSTISNLRLTNLDIGGYRNVGGLVAMNNGEVRNCFASGRATATRDNVGLLVGVNNGSVIESQATGTVSGDANVGGLVSVQTPICGSGGNSNPARRHVIASVI
jgi:hypothetical protein